MAKVEKLPCLCCGKEKAETKEFYLTKSRIYDDMIRSRRGRMLICKSCFFELYDTFKYRYQDELRALYHLCMMFDICYDAKLAMSSKSQQNTRKDKHSLLKNYMKNINSSIGSNSTIGKTSLDSEHIIMDDSLIEKQEKVEIKEIKKDKKSKIKIEERVIDDDIRRKWWREYSDEECLLLEEYYDDYYDKYNHEKDPAKLDSLKEVCTFKLIIAQAKKDRDNKTIREFSTLISQKLADAELKPSQQKKLGEADNDLYSRKLRILEKTRPVSSPLDEYLDVDKFWGYLNKHMIKPLAMALGLAKGEYDIEKGSEDIVIDDKLKNVMGDTDEN